MMSRACWRVAAVLLTAVLATACAGTTPPEPGADTSGSSGGSGVGGGGTPSIAARGGAGGSTGGGGGGAGGQPVAPGDAGGGGASVSRAGDAGPSAAAGDAGAAGPVAYRRLFGVNLAGAEFGSENLPGTYGTHYGYPRADEVDYFVAKKMNVIRVPFRWERLQRMALGPFDVDEQRRLDRLVEAIVGRGAWVILDPHNEARYFGKVVGSADLDVAVFADFWAKLAGHYRHPRTIYGLMNEPNEMPTEQWLTAANAAIAAIRKAGATNLILVPGNGYTSALSWNRTHYGTANSRVMTGVIDPLSNFAYEVHQYLDTNGSGKTDTCVSETIGSERLKTFTEWLRSRRQRAFLAEFAGGVSDVCLRALGDMLTYIAQNEAQWIGWTYWAAGPRWGDYQFSIEPLNGMDRPQMSVLSRFLTP